MTQALSIQDEGDRLLAHLLDIASGTFTKMETLDYAEQLELYMEGPCAVVRSALLIIEPRLPIIGKRRFFLIGIPPECKYR